MGLVWKQCRYIIKHQMDSLNMPGLSIAFINEDKIVYHSAVL